MSAEALADDLVAALDEHLPTVLANIDYSQQVEVEPWGDLNVKPHQERDLTKFPTVEVVVRAERVVGRDMTEYGEQLLAVQYTVRVYATCRGGSYDETDRLRKRLVAAVRELVLGPKTPGEAVPSALRSSYSEIDRDRNGRTLAAGYVDCVLTVVEYAVTPTAGALPPEQQPVVPLVVGVHHIDEPLPEGTP